MPISQMSRDEFQTPRGRFRAWFSWFLADHGFLRLATDNSHQITDKMWRTFQPSPKKMQSWADRGIKTIINLRGTRNDGTEAGFYLLEEEICAKAGMELVNFRAFSRQPPSKEFVFGIKDLFEKIQYPAMLHCKSGADRAGIAMVLYMFLHEGRSLDEAMEQLSLDYWHFKDSKTGVLGFLFSKIHRLCHQMKDASPDQEHFLNWVEYHADPDAIKAEFKPKPYAIIIADWILRRE